LGWYIEAILAVLVEVARHGMYVFRDRVEGRKSLVGRGGF
jgi:hypothetical protein